MVADAVQLTPGVVHALRFGSVVSVVQLAIAGCGPLALPTQWRADVPQRDPCCHFSIYVGRVPEDYVELGIVDLAAFRARALPQRPQQLGPLLGPHVCTMGGNAVKPVRNEFGRYDRAVVLHLGPIRGPSRRDHSGHGKKLKPPSTANAPAARCGGGGAC